MIASNANERKLDAWIERIRRLLGDATGGLKLWIKDAGEGARREMLREYVIGPESDRTALALEILHDAQEEGDGTGNGVHQFFVYAFRSRETAHFQSHGFRLASEGAIEDVEKEQSDRAGFSADDRRHIEAMAKINVGMFHSMMSLTDQLARRIEAGEAREMEREARMAALQMERAKLEYDQESQKFVHGMIEKAAPGAIAVLLQEYAEHKARKKAEEGGPAIALPPQTVLPERAAFERPRLVAINEVSKVPEPAPVLVTPRSPPVEPDKPKRGRKR